MGQHRKRPAEDATSLAVADLDGLSRAELLGLWRAHYKAEPPSRLRRPLLELAVGWAIQAETHGGLSPAAARQLQGTTGQQPIRKVQRRRLKPGTRLVREWHGTVHVVEARERGFLWQGQSYASLSAIARAITGANWSGPRFFGLTAGTGS